MIALAAAAVLAAWQEEPAWRSFAGKTPPELAVPKERWFNADEPPSLEKLKGRVVWLEFIGSIF